MTILTWGTFGESPKVVHVVYAAGYVVIVANEIGPRMDAV